MAIKAGFTVDDMRAHFNRFFDKVEVKQIEVLKKLGEECVTRARSEHPQNWQDQTGNLRSSIGYMIFKDGSPISGSAFEQVSARNSQAGDVYDGAEQGMQFCKQIGESTTGYALVVVAGMNYAIHVEKNGRDVLTSAELHAEQTLPKMLEELKIDIAKAAE